MKRAFSVTTIFATLLATWLLLAASAGQAQTMASDQACAEAREKFVSIMESFRSAYFLRSSAGDTAELVLAEQVLPSAQQIYQVCPEDISAVVRGGVEMTNLSLSDPRRWQLVSCDRALSTYKKLLRQFESSVSQGYNAARLFIYGEIDPAALTAVEACPQMSDLAVNTRREVTELQKRIDRMEDIDNMGETMAEQIETRNAEFTEWFEAQQD